MFNRNRQQLETLTSNVGSASLPSVRHGRSLLWRELEPEAESENDEGNSESLNKNNSTSGTQQPMCPMYINQTESIRLDYELRRWIGRDSDREDSTNLPKPDTTIKSVREFLLPKPTIVKKKAKGSFKVFPSVEEEAKSRETVGGVTSMNSNAVEVFSPILRDHASLFDALRRRDDTFYVLWFTGEHLLLPASQKNNTVRPKMSLIFPAVTINGKYIFHSFLSSY